MLYFLKTLSKLFSDLIMYNSLKVIITTMIGFVTWPPFTQELIVMA